MKSRAFLGDLSRSNYLDLFRSGLEYIHFGKFVNKDSSIFIKPNLTFPHYKPGVMVSPEAVEAAILALRDYTSHILIGDSDSGGYNRFSMDEVFRETGIAEFAGKYGVQVVNLSHLQRKVIEFPVRNSSISLAMPRLLTDEIDLLITMPVPKIHNNTGVSLSFKNQWGCIPEPMDRLRLHPFFKEVILAVNQAVKNRVTLMDGRFGLNRNGPLRGDPVKLDWVMVCDTPGAAARLGCHLMQVELRKVRHLRYAEQCGLVPRLEEIETNLPLQPFQKVKFYLKREWTDLPGYLAFNNSTIAYLGYFSPLANFLHKILYVFREPFYDYDRYSVHRKGNEKMGNSGSEKGS